MRTQTANMVRLENRLKAAGASKTGGCELVWPKVYTNFSNDTAAVNGHHADLKLGSTWFIVDIYYYEFTVERMSHLSFRTPYMKHYKEAEQRRHGHHCL